MDQPALPIPDAVSALAYEDVAALMCESAVDVSWRAAGQVPGKGVERGDYIDIVSET